MIDFRRAALLKVAGGTTTFDEIQRVVPSLDDEDDQLNMNNRRDAGPTLTRD